MDHRLVAGGWARAGRADRERPSRWPSTEWSEGRKTGCPAELSGSRQGSGRVGCHRPTAQPWCSS